MQFDSKSKFLLSCATAESRSTIVGSATIKFLSFFVIDGNNLLCINANI